jgi:hypothetical protein
MEFTVRQMGTNDRAIWLDMRIAFGRMKPHETTPK